MRNSLNYDDVETPVGMASRRVEELRKQLAEAELQLDRLRDPHFGLKSGEARIGSKVVYARCDDVNLTFWLVS